MIYLDSASTTPISKDVLDEMMPFLTAEYGNPNSIHALGVSSRMAVDKARERVAEAINADPEQIIFTSGGSEANNLAIKGYTNCGQLNNPMVVMQETEHTSSIMSANSIGKDKRLFVKEITNLEVKKGRDVLLWNMYVNNETGFLNPVYEIGGMTCKDDNLYFGTDCVQAFGFERIDAKEMNCDFLTISSHKIHGPKGVGALYVKDKSLLSPLISGGINQEFGLRGGTENVVGIVGFGKACEIALKNREENRNRILHLRNLFLERLNGLNYNVNCMDNSKILSVCFHGIDAETLVIALSGIGVCISSGAACKNNELEANKALIAYGLTEEMARSTVRISFMESNTEDEVTIAANKIKSVVKILTTT